uniref:Uncharacterized protein n=1 Tax=Rhizophora mucronata TaxID=61149 RepID=A0A2P2NNH0_RHIMU
MQHRFLSMLSNSFTQPLWHPILIAKSKFQLHFLPQLSWILSHLRKPSSINHGTLFWFPCLISCSPVALI